MKKSEVSKILLHLWDSVDQAPYDDFVAKAFSSCPISVQKKIIERLIQHDSWDLELDEGVLEKAKKLVGIE